MTPANPFRPIRHWLYLALAVADGLALVVSFAVGTLIRFHGHYDSSGPELVGVIAPFFYFLGVGSDAYSLVALRDPYAGARKITWTFVLAIGASLALFFYARIDTDFSRLTLAVSGGIALIVLPITRIYSVLMIQDRFGGRFENVFLLLDDLPVDYGPDVRVIDVRAFGLEPALDDPEMMNRIGHLLRDADRAVVACTPGRRKLWADALRGLGHRIDMMTPELDELGALDTANFGTHRTVLVAVGPLALGDRVRKRAFDLIISLVLLLLLSPILVIIAILVRLDSPGPALFRQPRIGRGNRIFTVYKFRTMLAEQADHSASTLTARADPRVTKLGAFLRRTSLDELPQLLNVLNGSMSLVGPRPHALGALAGEKLYWEVDSEYWSRHSVAPGITGLAQIRGHRGTTFAPDDLEKRLQSDLEYISNWSLWRDIRILFSTFIVLVHENAF